jgi:hypothetical protein
VDSCRLCWNIYQEEKAARDKLLDGLVDVNRKQYSKLLALERKEMQSQKVLSDVWVKYIYLLVEMTIADSKEKGILFFNLDEFSQTLILRETANKLRELSQLPPYDVIYDPLDAGIIVEKLAAQSVGQRFGIDQPIDQVVTLLESKHSKLLKTVSASN